MKKGREERLPRIAVLEEVLHFHCLGGAFGNYVKAQHRLTGIASHLQQQHQAFSSDSNVFITSAPPASYEMCEMYRRSAFENT